jgi:superfamily II DNA or RNA helicase
MNSEPNSSQPLPNTQLDIFSQESARDIGYQLAKLDQWPEQSKFPLNLHHQQVKNIVINDLIQSKTPLIVTGYAALDRIIDLISDLNLENTQKLRILLGNEPFESKSKSFVLKGHTFSDELREYWLNRGISLFLSAKLIQAIELIKDGYIEARYFEDSTRRLHAKIYKGDFAITLGSSNFTQAGMSSQIEANVRFCSETDKKRYKEASSIAENYWSVGKDFTKDLLAILEQLLRIVTWEEALARAAAELLEGQWAEKYLSNKLTIGNTKLWPSQQAGIAQAMWVLDNIGSVLVADATGSGKTRMGAHLLRSLRDRVWSIGRTRSDISVLVCPPTVQESWEKEANNCGLDLSIRSHGVLSRKDSDSYDVTASAVRRAQTIAIDEAHNFLNLASQRTQEVLSNLADNVVLFTATPINRGASDLLSLVDMLGADNMEEETLDILEGLSRRKGSVEKNMTPKHVEALRGEIKRFTVRRTKSELNTLVDNSPEAYLDAQGKQCRYPIHKSMTYSPGESESDRKIADKIRDIAGELKGIPLLETEIEMPITYLSEGWSEETFLRGRLSATKHLAFHNVMSRLRSSKAALIEHLIGTHAAMEMFHIHDRIKQSETGDTIGKLKQRANSKKPVCHLKCDLPSWLKNDEEFKAECEREISHYEQILNLAQKMSSNREKGKARQLIQLLGKHRLIIAFDSHLISLEIINNELAALDNRAQTFIATGSDRTAKNKVKKTFSRESEEQGIALCSDSMSEGVNLQGASAIIHLDMPSVVRIAEQRVGRVDRMDSPHKEIQAWWPNDSEEFAIRSDERFFQRYQTVETLLGSNLPLPEEFINKNLKPATKPVELNEIIQEAERASKSVPWDGIQDAFSPVRELIFSETPLISEETYKEFIGEKVRVLSRVGIVSSNKPWAFFAISGFEYGAPKWIFIEHSKRITVRLDDVCKLLRGHLSNGVENLKMDQQGVSWLTKFLDTLSDSERSLLPKRKQRALEQMEDVLGQYLKTAKKQNDQHLAARWESILNACKIDKENIKPDLDAVAENWLNLIRPTWFKKLGDKRKRRRPLLIKDIRRNLIESPFSIEQVEEAFVSIPTIPPLDERIAACIIGVPKEMKETTI